MNFKQSAVFFVLIVYSLTLYQPVNFMLKNKATKVATSQNLDPNYLIYDRNSVQIYLPKSDLIRHCNFQLEKLHDEASRQSVISFKAQLQSDTSKVVINNQLVYLKDTFQLVQRDNDPGSFDTLKILNDTLQVNSNIYTLEWALNDLLRKGNFKVYDKAEKQFVDYIDYKIVNDPYGNRDLYYYLPDGTIFLNKRLTWSL